MRPEIAELGENSKIPWKATRNNEIIQQSRS
jgi:hypothetical protein